jgi:hypothetical protein
LFEGAAAKLTSEMQSRGTSKALNISRSVLAKRMSAGILVPGAQLLAEDAAINVMGRNSDYSYGSGDVTVYHTSPERDLAGNLFSPLGLSTSCAEFIDRAYTRMSDEVGESPVDAKWCAMNVLEQPFNWNGTEVWNYSSHNKKRSADSGLRIWDRANWNFRGWEPGEVLSRTEPHGIDEIYEWNFRLNLLEEILSNTGCVNCTPQRPHGLGLKQDSGGWFHITDILNVADVLMSMQHTSSYVSACGRLLSLIAWGESPGIGRTRHDAGPFAWAPRFVE